MGECADCGGPVEGFATYCDDCSGTTTATSGDGAEIDGREPATSTGRDGSATTTGSTTRTDGAPTRVGTFLALATAAGAYGILQTLWFLTQVLGYAGGADLFGNLYGDLLYAPFIGAYGVMAKRLLDGTADHARYARILAAFAVLTVAFTAVHELPVAPLARWLPFGADPGYVALHFLAYTPLGTFLPPMGRYPAFVVVVGVGTTALAAHHLRPTDR
ncbi:hypothetical protein [Halorubellus litoreus]|uniref:Zinc-ribbon domain-containing protein n=1 Tax=Halorubellus litoreus TaxID=755308 RepID=A0ABD5VCN2_9EURY